MAYLAAFLLVFVAAGAPSFALWPMPTELTEGSKGLKLAPSFSIHLSGSLAWNAPEDLRHAGKYQCHLVILSVKRDG